MITHVPRAAVFIHKWCTRDSRRYMRVYVPRVQSIRATAPANSLTLCLRFFHRLTSEIMYRRIKRGRRERLEID